MDKKIALLSVFEKEGIVEFAQALVALGWNLIASGGTAKKLVSAGLAVRDVAELVGGGAILGHRVVTLSREVHAGLLARDIPEDLAELERLGIPWIDLVCVDLYPLEQEIAKPESTPESVTKMTDIGGPTMLRSAAKGKRIVICDPADRMRVIEWLQAGRPDEKVFRQDLAAKAEITVAEYALASARYQSRGGYEGFLGRKVRDLPYCENRWQGNAALFSALHHKDPLAHENFRQIAGAPAGFINETDLYRLTQTLTHIAAGFEKNFGERPNICLGVKHGNVCGGAVGEDLYEVIEKMVEGDPLAIFGGYIMTNFPLNHNHAMLLRTWKTAEGNRRPLDGIIVPGIEDEAIKTLKRKDERCRVIVNPALACLGFDSMDHSKLFRQVHEGFLTQGAYDFVLDLNDPRLEIYGIFPDSWSQKDLVLAWGAGSTSNSNTITLARHGKILANAIGQQSRVAAATLALSRARASQNYLAGCVAYSDSFFPFDDAVKILIDAGVTVILTSKGGKNYEQVKQTCLGAGIVLVVGPDEVIRGFFGH
jgi:phosphoribosylaminoimidazolecarboxamide formyltransferase/IMP cyclohydrolase